MGDRVGYVFHSNWRDFSPLIYLHWGDEFCIPRAQRFLKHYWEVNKTDSYNGRKFSGTGIAVEFVLECGDTISRLINLDEKALKGTRSYKHDFDEDLYVIDVSYDNFGNLVLCHGGGSYTGDLNIFRYRKAVEHSYIYDENYDYRVKE